MAALYAVLGEVGVPFVSNELGALVVLKRDELAPGLALCPSLEVAERLERFVLRFQWVARVE